MTLPWKVATMYSFSWYSLQACTNRIFCVIPSNIFLKNRMQSNSAPALYHNLVKCFSLDRLNDFVNLCSSNSRSNSLNSDVGFPLFFFATNFKSTAKVHFVTHKWTTNECSNDWTTLLIEVGTLQSSQSNVIVVSL